LPRDFKEPLHSIVVFLPMETLFPKQIPSTDKASM